MNREELNRITEILGATAECFGQQVSAMSLAMMASDLSLYPFTSVESAIVRVRRECQRMTLAAILERINSDDGRPTPDEAWAMALEARDEAVTVVWTDEMQEAFAIARPVLDAGDKIGARMAFRDAYERITRDARDSNRNPQWKPSLGWDVTQREIALSRAVDRGLISAEAVSGFLPAPRVDIAGLLAGPDAAMALGSEQAKIRCTQIREMLSQDRRWDAAQESARHERERFAAAKADMQKMVSERMGVDA